MVRAESIELSYERVQVLFEVEGGEAPQTSELLERDDVARAVLLGGDAAGVSGGARR